MNDVLKDAESRMKKSIESLKSEFNSIRIGKATPALLDNIRVEYYGTNVPLNQVSNISAPEPRLLVIQPWEKDMVAEVNKAIQKSELGLNPSVDGQIIRIPIPPLSEERRKETAKLVKKTGEEGKIAIRNIRRDANDTLKSAEKEKEISEDEMRKGFDRVQELTDKYTAKVDEMIESKEKEVMEV
ncbi:MAG: ribosome recycling factor [candidate division Zixibacteria bacterium]|nr:ribosome recycling factor [candidate division Zixibacteria bacterium]